MTWEEFEKTCDAENFEMINSLEQQNKALQVRIKELEEPKTCDRCKFFFQRFTDEGYLKYNVCDNLVTQCHDKFYCSLYKPKQSL